MQLYPLKFKPIYKSKIWGGTRMQDLLQKDFSPLNNCGESWEISGIEGQSTVISNGFLKGNSLEEILEIYMDQLVGGKVFETFGYTFPLLVKFIDANADLSVQVHPNDEMAQWEEKSSGKTEMWYVLDALPEAKINVGFNQPMDEEKLRKHILSGTVKDVLNYINVKQGDVFFIPAGKVHAIGSGILLAEIQQPSDITYRLYDYERKDENGNLRPLHIEKACKAIDYQNNENAPVSYKLQKNENTSLISSPFFTTNVIYGEKIMDLDYKTIDSFVILVCVEGSAVFSYDGGKEKISKGESLLLPATFNEITIIPEGSCKLLESYLELD